MLPRIELALTIATFTILWAAAGCSEDAAPAVSPVQAAAAPATATPGAVAAIDLGETVRKALPEQLGLDLTRAANGRVPDRRACANSATDNQGPPRPAAGIH
jgi:hypothetical protein